MLATRYKFSPRTIPGFFSQAKRSRKSGYSILVLPIKEQQLSSKLAVVLVSSAAKTAIKRHAVKRSVYHYLEQWVASGGLQTLTQKGHLFYLVVVIEDWQRAQGQLRTQDWQETVEYLLEHV